MHFTSAIATLAMMAASVSALENVASFEAYIGPGCQPQAQQLQNINSDECQFLPRQSAKVFFLEKSRANCRLQFFVSGDCTGTPTDVITQAPSGCIDVAQKFSFNVVCT